MSKDLPVVAIVGATSSASRLRELLLPAAERLGFVLSTLDTGAAANRAALICLAGDEAHDQLPDLVGTVPATKVVAVGTDRAAKASWCLRRGATEYLCWETLERTPTAFEQLMRTLLYQSTESHVPLSAAATEVYRLARRVAASDVPVLIHGDSGTGKEVLARFVHAHSLRCEGPFVAVNCAAIPENMLEATLFGHEKGAFTGADRRREGKFLVANEGTLLLDEITEMPIELQAKLLRAIQEQEVEPLGARDAIATNVRIIATSNRDLKKSMEEGRLRLDLYYRLSVFPLQVPSLVQRSEDILPLAELFAGRYQTLDRDCAQSEPIFDQAAEAALLSHNWPGNVRELENRVQRALILTDKATIGVNALGLDASEAQDGVDPEPIAAPFALEQEPASLLPADADGVQPGGAFKTRLDAQESALILQALSHHGGQRKATAAALGFSERTLRYRLKRMRDAGVNVS
ncbi:MAG: sigma-54 interaction domain-containing protein [Pseudomonadales bacterium]